MIVEICRYDSGAKHVRVLSRSFTFILVDLVYHRLTMGFGESEGQGTFG